MQLTADLVSVKDVPDEACDDQAALLFVCFHEVKRHLDARKLSRQDQSMCYGMQRERFAVEFGLPKRCRGP